MRLSSGLLAVALMSVCVSCSESSTRSVPPPIAASAPTTSTPTYHFTGANSGRFCAMVDRLLNRSELTQVATNPSALEAAIANYEPFLGMVSAQAPTEVATDVKIDVSVIRMQFQALRAAKFQLLNVNQTQFGGFLSPIATQAVNRLKAYERQVCHLTPSSLVLPTAGTP